jgi:hypothetical protein
VQQVWLRDHGDPVDFPAPHRDVPALFRQMRSRQLIAKKGPTKSKLTPAGEAFVRALRACVRVGEGA